MDCRTDGTYKLLFMLNYPREKETGTIQAVIHHAAEILDLTFIP